MSDPETLSPRTGLRGTWARVLTACVLVPVVVCAVLWGPTWLVAVLVGVVMALALYEFFGLAEKVGLRGYMPWTIFCALGLVLAQWSAQGVETWTLGGGVEVMRGRDALVVPLDLVLLVFVLGLGALAIVGRGERGFAEVLGGIGASAGAMLLVALPVSYIVALHGVQRIGPRLLLFLLALVWVGDTLAYFVGSAVGRLKMARVLSPKKTWEGAAANVVGALLVALVFMRWLPVEPLHLLLMAALANVAGQLGDLVESACKRCAGAKDSGGLLPGHGGMLDRIDSLVFAAPVVWYYFRLVIQGRGW